MCLKHNPRIIKSAISPGCIIFQITDVTVIKVGNVPLPHIYGGNNLYMDNPMMLPFPMMTDRHGRIRGLGD
ncbi:hypothetical protein CEXT_459001 [Caerostris extrusa]|uniref:Uncharacterized protein n=1 Tax=Caerostris extrusa TaxID=172846 RepID=A0AAV4MJM8_CAEEX|nr:hypothetical protein CEXT_459001 [Caerostris extrusa]